MAIVQSIIHFLEDHFTQAQRRTPDGAIRSLLAGPPSDYLQSIFDSLTEGGKKDWNLPGSGDKVAVLLILGSREGRRDNKSLSLLSKECQWDYALNVRNSSSLILMLVDPSAWDSRPESLVNTTEVLGVLQSSQMIGWFNNPLWVHLIGQIASNLNIEKKKVKEALVDLMKESYSLDVLTKNTFIWQVVDDLLTANPIELDPDNRLAFGVGFPALGKPAKSISEAYRIINRLGEFIKRQGLIDGFERLKNTSSANTLQLKQHLDYLQEHISDKSLSGMGFAYSPIWHYRPSSPVPDWWPVLNVGVLESLLEEAGAGDRPPSQLNLVCENSINKQERPPREPLIVISNVQLRATDRDEQQINNAGFQRQIPGHPLETLLAVPGDESACVDLEQVQHDKPIKYTVTSTGYRTGACEVIILNSFGCRGHARVTDAESNPPPAKIKKQNSWKQEITLARGGAVDLDVYFSADADQVTVTSPSMPPITLQTVKGQSFLSFVVLIEDETPFNITLKDSNGAILGEWEATLTIQETTETARTRFDGLVTAHKETGRVGIPSMPDSIILKIEDEYLDSHDSWKPIKACWSNSIPSTARINWNDQRLGDISPRLGLPPKIEIPPDVQLAREEIRNLLKSKKRPIEEINLDETGFDQPVEKYLKAFLNWLNDEPDKAPWIDCIAMYTTKKNLQAGGFTASEEPVAIILSPLHPLKIGWQILAQQQLVDGLNQNQRCPAAGLILPSTCPDIGGWSISLTRNALTFRAFLAAPCDNPYWGLFWNRNYLDKEEDQEYIRERLNDIGLETRALTGGFSRSQAIHSIEDISDLMPGRATLRLGIIGNSNSSSSLSTGVIDWCNDQFDDENTNIITPMNIEVYDMRGDTQPTPGVLAVLSEETHEKARWFRIGSVPSDAQMDLIILDNLGSTSQSTEPGTRRSLLSIGGLFRLRIKQDFDDALFVMESRIGKRLAKYEGGLTGLLQETITRFEEIALTDKDISQFRFRPNQQAIGNRLEQSTYLAMTSSQLDPGGIIRGVTGQQGYLWDYELPGILGGDDESAGYYLVAKPLEAMKDAIRNSAALVISSKLTDDEVQHLIQEISRRAIPVLKRLASGGSQSRGELGLLLGTRLIQDVFNPGKPKGGLPVWEGDCVHLILPVDPFEEPFEKIRVPLCGSNISAKRSDLLVIAIKISEDDAPATIKITPVEVKFRGDTTMSTPQLQEALDQASTLSKVLDAAWVQVPINELWDTCSRALLAECVDFAFRIYANTDIHIHKEEEWAELHERVLESIFNKQASIVVNSGRLIVFDKSSQTSIIDVDNDGLLDTVIVNPANAAELLCEGKGISSISKKIVEALDFSLRDYSGITKPEIEVGIHGGSSTIEPHQESQKDKSPEQPSPNNVVETKPIEDSIPKKSNPSIPDSVKQQVNEAFEGFIGNEAAVRLLRNDLLSALIEKPPHLKKNFLFTGEPSTGKTELARRIALALKLPFVRLDGRGLTSRERLFELVNGELGDQSLSPSRVGQQSGLPVLEYPPLIIFIDEVHLVPRSIQESLLTLLETVDRTVTMKSFVARMTKTTFLFATTRSSDLDRAFRSRCTDILLREYTIEEVAEMIKRRFIKDWPNSVNITLAKLGRRVPRVAFVLAQDLETQIKVSDNQEATIEEHLEDVRKSHGLDEIGLTRLDYQYLEILENEVKPLGEQAIVNLLATADKDRIIYDVEPFLRKLGFIRFSSRGREITDKGSHYLLEAKKKSGGILP